MQNAQKNTGQKTPPWVLRTLAGFVLVFAGFAVFQLVSAQTANYPQPGCNPVTNPGACNPGGPLLLTAGTKQTLESDIDLGKTGATKNLGIYGNITLNTGTGFASKLITPVGGIGGNPINIESALVNSILADNAIVGKTTAASGKAGIYGIATNAAAYGVYAINTANTTASYALFADGGSTGNAAQFTGKLKFMLAADPTNKYATLALDANGNLDFGINTAGKGLTVNGIAAGSTSTNKATKINDVAAGATYQYFVRPGLFPSDKQYEVTSIQVLYDDNGTADIWWQPLPKDKFSYTECEGALFKGRLDLNAFPNIVDYRIIVTYDPQAAFLCPGQDNTAPTGVLVILSTSAPTGAACTTPSSCVNWQTGTVNMTASASDNVGVTSVEYFVNGISKGTTFGNSPWTLSLNTTSLTNSCSGTFNPSGVCSVALTSYVLTAKATDAAGNVSVVSPGKTIYVTNGQSKEPCNDSNSSVVCATGTCTYGGSNAICEL